ncbi:VON WILLEBRAND FACTOR A DOMAIN PROTEIN [Salix purpurea]|uniref:VON WILLEBRAND FACTOR A DOMAIN PROTEIN n=2 Tax=Salix TaxID=40685 RepID=A0A9Q0VGW8_SALPP|nr:VON WILLEBRAND FACTOR A DOMAIN PROTEIN [Salix purpurea]
MDGRAGCCHARYAGVGGGYDMSKVEQIMLSFRPIAPKPATATAGSSVSGCWSSLETSDASPRSGRGKRKYCYTRNGTNSKKCSSGGNRKGKVLGEENKAVADSVVTLPLLPETPDRRDLGAKELKNEVGPCSVSPMLAQSIPEWLTSDCKVKDQAGHQNRTAGFGVSTDQTAVASIVGSCVTVECVTDTWVDVDGLGRTDDEKKINMEKDTCPGFISDDFGRVTWTNEAYRKMVGQGEGGDRQVFVWLAMKEKVPMAVTIAGHKAFTCRVRVQYQKYDTCRVNLKEKISIVTVPCDVWRMDSGCFAWRLDVKAALCLGR